MQFSGRIESVNTPAGHDEISRLAKTIWHEHYTPLIGAAQVEYMLERGYTPIALAREQAAGARLLLAHEYGQAVGFAGWSPDADDPVHAWLDRLYVLDSARGRGVASALIARIVDDLATRDQLSLRVNRHNSGSIRAYERLGFRILHTDVKDIGDGFVMDDYIMQRTL